MTFTDKRKRFFTLAFIAVIFLLVGGYAFFRTKDLLAGPKITIISPENGASLTVSATLIRGTAKNISSLSLDDRPIYVDDKGNFSEIMALSPGYNILSLKAEDKFGKKKEVALELVLVE